MQHTHDHCGHQHNGHQGCGHGASCHCGGGNQEISINERELELLLSLGQTPYLPLTRFIMESGSETGFVAIAPVYLENPADSLETVRASGELLTGLANKGLISLDYGQPLGQGDYSDYEGSNLFSYFSAAVELGIKMNALSSYKAAIEKGSLALTPLGQTLLEHIGTEPFDTIEFSM